MLVFQKKKVSGTKKLKPVWLTNKCVRPWAAAVSVAATGGCRREVEGVGVASRCVRVSAMPIARLYGETCTSLYTLISDGPARPLGYPKAETPIREESSGPSTPGPPREVGLPAGEGWADTGSAGSVAIDSDSSTAATVGLTIVPSEVAAADEAASPGSTSLYSLGSYLASPRHLRDLV